MPWKSKKKFWEYTDINNNQGIDIQKQSTSSEAISYYLLK